MRTIIMTICYGLALGLGLLALGLAGYGFYQHRSIFVSDQGIAAVGIAINAALYIATGAVSGVAALALVVAGGRARA